MNTSICKTSKENIQSERWFQNGDCLADKYIKGTPNEGELVRRYRNPNLNGLDICKNCGYYMHDHGFIEYNEQTVCPGNYIIKEDKEKYITYSPNEFKKLKGIKSNMLASV